MNATTEALRFSMEINQSAAGLLSMALMALVTLVLADMMITSYRKDRQ